MIRFTLQPFVVGGELIHLELQGFLSEGVERLEAMLTGARPFSGPSLPFCLPVIAARSIVLSIGAESWG
jgi:hypothetical protein